MIMTLPRLLTFGFCLFLQKEVGDGTLAKINCAFEGVGREEGPSRAELEGLEWDQGPGWVGIYAQPVSCT